VDDKRVIWVLTGCLGIFFVLVCGGGGAWVLLGSSGEDVTVGPAGPGEPKPTAPTVGPTPTPGDGPRHVVATVSASTGSTPVPVGARCAFDVERVERDDGTFWCNAQVQCGGVLLYGNVRPGMNSGFFPCTLHETPTRHVRGRDDQTTSQDTDASIHLDTMSGVLTVRDDASGPHGAYSLTANVLGVR